MKTDIPKNIMTDSQKLFLPVTMDEARARGWSQLDVILLSGDAYIDHPSFGAAIVGRFLESLGVRVGIIAAPDVNSPDDFRKLGRPAWFFGVTAGNLDSMIMCKTASKKKRSDDAYLPEGMEERRPRRATIAYCNAIKKLFKNTEIIIGGVEASLRRFAHYDYWDNRVRRSILFDTRADLLVYGMAENPLKEIVTNFKRGIPLKEMTDIPGTALILGRESICETQGQWVNLPSFEDVSTSKKAYLKSSRLIHLNLNPWSSKTLKQMYGGRALKVLPPALPLTEGELDGLYALPYRREPHPSYGGKKIPAFEMIKYSVTAMRGCFGGCSFCALTVHQGKTIQSRSHRSILSEIKEITALRGFKGYISDIGGPSANMYRLGCGKRKAEVLCKRLSCLTPSLCRNLDHSHNSLVDLLTKVRKAEGVKKAFIASGVRYDLANLSKEYVSELARYHVSGQLKVAPEHSHPEVLKIMRKPDIQEFETFKKRFMEESKRAGLEQYVIPYFISAHPGCGVREQLSLALYLKRNNIRPRQVQEFIPAPMTLAADIFYTGVDPITEKEVYTAVDSSERKIQRILMQYFKPENRKAILALIYRWGASNKKSKNKHIGQESTSGFFEKDISNLRKLL